MKKWILLIGLLIPALSQAQSYSINWHKAAGGGGTSSNAPYNLSGTIGQHDAGGPMTGGNYSVTGGYWSLISVVQTAGVPNLTIQFVRPNSVVVSWPATGNFNLQQNGNLSASSGWTLSSYPITTANGVNSITITPPQGHLYFRLVSP